jgi:membrane protease YdiL (CAAX protease family)
VSAVELRPVADRSVAAPARAVPGRGWTLGGAAVVVLGCVLLEARPALVGSSSHPGALLVLLFLALLAVGALWPLPDDPLRPRAGVGRTTAVVLVGVGAFALGRVVGGGHAPVPATLAFIAANTLAAVAEEAFFRRLCFGLLAPAGTAWAVFGSALLFAIVHVTTYGWWVLPLDLAAGLVFGWQRVTTGSWSAPAVTHVVVNLLVVL